MGLFDLIVFFAVPIFLVVFDVGFAFGIGGCGFVPVVVVGVVAAMVVVLLLLLMRMRMIGSN